MAIEHEKTIYVMLFMMREWELVVLSEEVNKLKVGAEQGLSEVFNCLNTYKDELEYKQLMHRVWPLLKMKNEKLQYILVPLLIIAIAVIFRIIPHPANVVPIAAMALFGGAYLDKKYALVVPLSALFISDLIIGFHASMLMVYISFVITGCIGLWLAKHKNMTNIVAASLASSLLFYILTNFNYWYATGWGHRLASRE